MKISVLLILLCLSLGACGQKGPLYLPPTSKPQPEVSAPQSAPKQPVTKQSATKQSKADQAEADQTNQPAALAE